MVVVVGGLREGEQNTLACIEIPPGMRPSFLSSSSAMVMLRLLSMVGLLAADNALCCGYRWCWGNTSMLCFYGACGYFLISRTPGGGGRGGGASGDFGSGRLVPAAAAAAVVDVAGIAFVRYHFAATVVDSIAASLFVLGQDWRLPLAGVSCDMVDFDGDLSWCWKHSAAHISNLLLYRAHRGWLMHSRAPSSIFLFATPSHAKNFCARRNGGRKAAAAAAVSALVGAGSPGSAEALFGRGKTPEMPSVPAIEQRVGNAAGEMVEAAETVRFSDSGVLFVLSLLSSPCRGCGRRCVVFVLVSFSSSFSPLTGDSRLHGSSMNTCTSYGRRELKILEKIMANAATL